MSRDEMVQPRNPEALPPITVELRGKASELLAPRIGSNDTAISQNFRTRVPVQARTPRQIIQEIADMNPLLADQIIREDGSPRSSTKILINGKPPASLDAQIITTSEMDRRKQQGSPAAARRDPIIIVVETDDEIVVIVVTPCDG